MSWMRKLICRLAPLIDQKNLEISEAGEQSWRLTQRRLADETGVAVTTINRLYRNDFTRVDVNTVEKLCDYFSCEAGDLFVLKDLDA
jgi:putative transcriptional regulator